MTKEDRQNIILDYLLKSGSVQGSGDNVSGFFGNNT